MPTITLSAAQFAAGLRQVLAAQADPVRARQMQAYMKQHFGFFGISTPLRRAAVKPMVAALGKHVDGDWLLAVAETLWGFDERECQYVAVDLLVTGAGRLEARHEPRLAMLIRQKSWWDSVDLLASRVYGTLCRNAPELRVRLDGYAGHECLWLRRVAILYQLNYGADTDLDRLSATLVANLGDEDFFIRKAMGWALRQFARTDPKWVRNWITAYAGQVSGLTRREALKHL
jgi:3-methyladenine DNA glycosylase AlkD